MGKKKERRGKGEKGETKRKSGRLWRVRGGLSVSNLAITSQNSRQQARQQTRQRTAATIKLAVATIDLVVTAIDLTAAVIDLVAPLRDRFK